MAGQHAYLQRLVPAHFGGGGCHVPVVDKHWSSPGSVGPDSRLGDCPRDGSYAAPGAGIPDVHQPIPKTWLQPPAAFRQRRTGCSLRTSHYAPGLADDPDHLHAPAIRQAAIACCNITRRRHVYINFWYPIVRSEDLAPDIPQKVRVLGCDLVAFRDQQGQARVLSDTCTHRGASLGGAWSNAGQPRIINGCIVCPYHGWEFGGDGECKNIPSLRHQAPGTRQGRFLSDRGEVRHRVRVPRRPAGERAPAPAADRGVRPAGLACQPGAGARGQLLLRALHRERPRPGAQRIRTPDPRPPGRQPRDLPGERVRGGGPPPGLGLLVHAQVRLAAAAAAGSCHREGQRYALGRCQDPAHQDIRRRRHLRPEHHADLHQPVRGQDVSPVLLRAAGGCAQDEDILPQHAQLPARPGQRCADPRAQQGHRRAGHRTAARGQPGHDAAQQVEGGADARRQGHRHLPRVAAQLR
ncbi:Rieske (2Fe-2S) protein [Gammaproteobacteria bacterium PRO2]|nr:Rieske (2Fe-2S) protein [Gammaproteobacteria bacterium PRO2]